MEERGEWHEASLEVLIDRVHAVNLYALDNLPEPPGEVPYGFQRANISLFPYRIEILRDVYCPNLIE